MINNKLRLFWVGKKKKTKRLTIEYLEGLKNPRKRITLWKLQTREGISDQTIRKTIKGLYDNELLEHYLGKELTLEYAENKCYVNRWYSLERTLSRKEYELFKLENDNKNLILRIKKLAFRVKNNNEKIKYWESVDSAL